MTPFNPSVSSHHISTGTAGSMGASLIYVLCEYVHSVARMTTRTRWTLCWRVRSVLVDSTRPSIKTLPVVGPPTSGPDFVPPPRVIVQTAGFSDTTLARWTLPGKGTACPGQRPEGVDVGVALGKRTGYREKEHIHRWCVVWARGGQSSC